MAHPPPSRLVVNAEALAWLAANPAPEGASVVTSLPDVSEIPALDLEGWKRWFVDAARAVIRWTPEAGVAVFFQSDIRRGGHVVDKGFLVMKAAEAESASLVFHKIVCRKPPGTIAFGRPSFSHMIAVSRREQAPPRHPGPDVLPDAGLMPWSRAMGAEACLVACRYLREDIGARVIVDPFCGQGTALAAANALGLDAIGIELSPNRCKKARALRLPA